MIICPADLVLTTMSTISPPKEISVCIQMSKLRAVLLPSLMTKKINAVMTSEIECLRKFADDKNLNGAVDTP